MWPTIFIMFAGVLQVYSQEDTSLPNIIFMMADDLGYGDVGYNKGNAQTPNLDQMAEGPNTILMRRYYSGSPGCSPTRGTVLTGRNHNRYCIWSSNVGSDTDDFVIPQRMPLPTNEYTVAKMLKKAGYQTAMYGKWHLGDLRPVEAGNPQWPVSHPGMHGFDKWLVTTRSAPTYNPNCACYSNASSLCKPLGHYHTLPPCSNYYYSHLQNNILEHYELPVRGDDSSFIVDQFEDFLTTRNSSSPMFVYLAFHSVHYRYIASPEMRHQYRLAGYTKNQADYYGVVTALDDAVGRVRQLLRLHNISHNTMLWFTSDNGPTYKGTTGGLRGRKGSLYEGGIRVPGLIEWPAVISQNQVTNFPVVSSDLLPTVGDIVKSQSSGILDGVSVLPMIKGKKNQRNSSIKWAFKVPADFSGKYSAAISNDRFKVHATYDNNRIVRASLYDLAYDPYEKTNMAFFYVKEFRSLQSELEEWRQSVIYSANVETQCYGNSSPEYLFYKCHDKKLINFNKRCNGIPDCKTDEFNCERCWGNAFHCDNNRCLRSSLVCNRRNNCGDNSDETCRACLPSHALCDGKKDCPDSSDELNCPQTTPPLQDTTSPLHITTPPLQETILSPPETTPPLQVTTSTLIPWETTPPTQEDTTPAQLDRKTVLQNLHKRMFMEMLKQLHISAWKNREDTSSSDH